MTVFLHAPTYTTTRDATFLPAAHGHKEGKMVGEVVGTFRSCYVFVLYILPSRIIQIFRIFQIFRNCRFFKKFQIFQRNSDFQ